jgi:hypothetical protein
MLIYSGVLTHEALDKALETQQVGRDQKLLGEILVEQGALEVEKLKATIRRQLEEEIWELFSWESGNFRFEQSEPPHTGGVAVELEVGPVLQEGNPSGDQQSQ